MITLAFYIGAKGDWQDKLICAVTRGPYSHVELAYADAGDGKTWCVGASGRDGGVRTKALSLGENWVQVDLPHESLDAVLDHCLVRIGRGYDLTGAVLSPARLPFYTSLDRWFCSELIADALGLDNAHHIHPNQLFEWAVNMGGRVRNGNHA